MNDNKNKLNNLAIEAEKTINKLGGDIRKLESELNYLGADARIAYHDYLISLKAKRDQMIDKLDAAKQVTNDKANSIVTGVSAAWQELVDAFESAKEAMNNRLQ